MGRVITVPAHPQRVISLVPSQTELLFDLGLDDLIVGVTKFCIYPADKVREKRRVGGTKQLQLDAIHQLQPDLIIGNKEENCRDDILELAESYPVWMSDIMTLDDAIDMIRRVGEVVAKRDTANTLAHQIASSFSELPALARPLRVAYFIWRKPLMVAGANTFINDMLGRCGMANAFADRQRRYPEVSLEEVNAAGLDAILLSSEPYPFREKHRAAFTDQFPGTLVHLVDGEKMSWYGSRLRFAPSYMKDLIGRLQRRRHNSE
ncbi:MAG: ABC transporter substrate-binding protein [Gemmatimonadota bacterium]|nr:MAG: ABC transporter substrate-binding protein [Gemmatimonadota bacterium]